MKTLNEKEMEEFKNLLSLEKCRTKDDYIKLAEYSEKGSIKFKKKWEEKDNSELDILIREYSSLRQESINSVNNRIQAMVLGFAAIAALISATFAVSDLRNNSSIVTIIFSIGIPLSCIFTFLIWLSEAIRSHRVGYYLASVTEARINKKLGKLVLSWESGLWTGLLNRDELFGPSMIALAVLGIIACGSPIFGLLINGISLSLKGEPLIMELWIPYGFLILTAIYAISNMPHLRNNPKIQSKFNEKRTS